MRFDLDYFCLNRVSFDLSVNRSEPYTRGFAGLNLQGVPRPCHQGRTGSASGFHTTRLNKAEPHTKARESPPGQRRPRAGPPSRPVEATDGTSPGKSSARFEKTRNVFLKSLISTFQIINNFLISSKIQYAHTTYHPICQRVSTFFASRHTS